jgi:PIN domain nuclease of toxin-antitoxin system
MLNLDTHILLHALAGNLTTDENNLLASDMWGISDIVIWEISKLAQLRRIVIDLNDPVLIRLLSSIQIWPISLEICRQISNLDFRGDPADEIIAATSLQHGAPLVTRDATIRKSRVVPLVYCV